MGETSKPDKGVSDKVGPEHFKKGSDKDADDGVSDKGSSDKSTGSNYSDNRNKNYLRNVYLLHILLVFPFFLLLCRQKQASIMGYSSKILGYTLLTFMGYSLLKSEITGDWNWGYSDTFNFDKKQQQNNSSRLRLVYIFHIITVVPLLIYYSSDNQQVSGALCSMGLLALMYHGYSYNRSVTSGQWNW